MNLSIFHDEHLLPSLVAGKLASLPLDYKEKYQFIKSTGRKGTDRLGAGVVLLLQYKKTIQRNDEYVFQLIKRSDKVTQSGDISCPGGMLHPDSDYLLSRTLAPGVIARMPDHLSRFMNSHDKETIDLIHLFLGNALREAWEEIGLDPLRVLFLGALPCYSLVLFARTIFPLVCFIPEQVEFKLNDEVEKIIEIPISTFFDTSNYAYLEIESTFHDKIAPIQKNQFPCIILEDTKKEQDILWGATFNIIMDFLRIISDNGLPAISPTKTIKKNLTKTYVFGSTR